MKEENREEWTVKNKWNSRQKVRHNKKTENIIKDEKQKYQ
jgi:hypothetical protein